MYAYMYAYLRTCHACHTLYTAHTIPSIHIPCLATALTIPKVTVFCSCKGEPRATTNSPVFVKKVKIMMIEL